MVQGSRQLQCKFCRRLKMTIKKKLIHFFQSRLDKLISTHKIWKLIWYIVELYIFNIWNSVQKVLYKWYTRGNQDIYLYIFNNPSSMCVRIYNIYYMHIFDNIRVLTLLIHLHIKRIRSPCYWNKSVTKIFWTLYYNQLFRRPKLTNTYKYRNKYKRKNK